MPRSLVRTKPKTRRHLRQPRQPQSLLILHLDAEKLRADGLHLGNTAELVGTLSAVMLGSPVTIKESTSLQSLLTVLTELSNQTFDVIVVVAHSNASGIRIATNHSVDWNAFGRYLEPFRPRRLLLVACQAGRWDAGEALFTTNGSLRRIFACPMNANKDLGELMMAAVPYVVSERAPSDKHVRWGQLACIALTGRQLREWRRITDKGNLDGAVLDLVAEVAEPLARSVPGVIDAILKSRR